MEEKKVNIAEESLEILKSNVPGLLTMLIVNPKSISKKTIILTLFLPILINFVKYCLNYQKLINKMMTFELSRNESINGIAAREMFRDFFYEFSAPEENNVIRIDKILNPEISYSTNNETLKIHFTAKLLNKFFTKKKLTDEMKEILGKLKNKKLTYNASYGSPECKISCENVDVILNILNFFKLYYNGDDELKKIDYCVYDEANGFGKFKLFYSITFDDIFLKQESQIKTQIDKWLKKENYYKKHSLPHKFIMLLHGEPGTGKTSISRVLAGYLNYKYIEFKCNKGNEFDWIESRITSQEKVVVLIDEIDRNIDQLNKTKFVSSGESKTTTNNNGDILAQCLMKLFESQDLKNVVIILTTNKTPDYFDSALMRPGRIDYCEHFSNCDSYQFKKIYQKYVGGEIPEDYVFPDGKYSPSHVINRVCVPWHDQKEKIFEMLV